MTEKKNVLRKATGNSVVFFPVTTKWVIKHKAYLLHTEVNLTKWRDKVKRKF